MTAPEEDDIHYTTVRRWMDLNVKKLAPNEQVLILEKAIHAIELRACMTLSSVTLMVVLDRVLCQTKEKFPVLSKAVLEKKSLSFKAVDKVQHAHETSEALAFLLVELFRVLGRLTADILTLPLHKELMKVTSNDSGES